MKIFTDIYQRATTRLHFLHQNQCHFNSLDSVIDLLKTTYCSKVSQYLLSFWPRSSLTKYSPQRHFWVNKEEFLRFDVSGLLMWQLLVIDEFTEGFCSLIEKMET